MHLYLRVCGHYDTVYAGAVTAGDMASAMSGHDEDSSNNTAGSRRSRGLSRKLWRLSPGPIDPNAIAATATAASGSKAASPVNAAGKNR